MELQSLYEKLTGYGNLGNYPFHMPGHKRNLMEFVNPFSIDITEIDGFDNLHHPEGILKEAMEAMADIYGADKSYFLVNGSTAGILSSICGTTKRRGKILMARNCHKAVYHGVFLQELSPVYSYPQYIEDFRLSGGLNAAEIEKLLISNPDIQTVIITSPTYEGIVSDVKAIADCVHKYHIPLIVDEAHGAHFRYGSTHRASADGHSANDYGEGFPTSALELGADIVIQSLHKTLPALTQTAVLHVKGPYVDLSEIERYLGIFQSSSPSYVLLSSMIECVRFMETDGLKFMEKFEENLGSLRERCRKLKNIRMMDRHFIGKCGIFDIDSSKLVFSVSDTNMDGPQLYDRLLNHYHLQMEMCGPSHVLAMTTVGDSKEGLMALGDALEEIDGTLNRDLTDRILMDKVLGIDNRTRKQELSPYEAIASGKKKADLKDSIGEVCAEFIYAYPPGVPVLVPGEVINDTLVDGIMEYQKIGISLQGMEDHTLETINIVNKI